MRHSFIFATTKKYSVHKTFIQAITLRPDRGFQRIKIIQQMSLKIHWHTDEKRVGSWKSFLFSGNYRQKKKKIVGCKGEVWFLISNIVLSQSCLCWIWSSTAATKEFLSKEYIKPDKADWYCPLTKLIKTPSQHISVLLMT